MIYLDNAATTKPLPEVVDAMLPFLQEKYGNPSSLHVAGSIIRQAIEEARLEIAQFVAARSPGQIIFTSGATESISLAFASVANEATQIVTSTVEHSCVLTAAGRWSNGRPTVCVPVNRDGLLKVEELEAAVRKAPSFVSLMLANNETGILFDIRSAAQICRKFGAVLHLDAAQALGKIPVNVHELGCDFLSFSGHKFHGPKGVGGLYAKRPASIQPVFPGHQEGSKRGGTENVPAIIGMAAAARVLRNDPTNYVQVASLRNELERSILSSIPEAFLNGHEANRTPFISNISLPPISAADFVVQLSRRGLCISAGAACSSGGRPSHVILAMHDDPMRAESSLRISLSRFTTGEEMTSAASTIIQTYQSSALRRFDISV